VSTDAAARTATLLAALWQKNQPLMLERLALLDRAAANPTPELRAEAIAVAHKLAGTLGMIGFPEGTTLAREIEMSLEGEGGDIAPLAAKLRAMLFPAK
jgi:HPt (histidine-containing phosphotransfer) domain-containing protein